MTVSHFTTERNHQTSGTLNTAASNSQALWHQLATMSLWCSTVTAVSLTRASKYPTVPWRSFQRKIRIMMTVREHYIDVTWGSWRQNNRGPFVQQHIYPTIKEESKFRITGHHWCFLAPGPMMQKMFLCHVFLKCPSLCLINIISCHHQPNPLMQAPLFWHELMPLARRTRAGSGGGGKWLC